MVDRIDSAVAVAAASEGDDNAEVDRRARWISEAPEGREVGSMMICSASVSAPRRLHPHALFGSFACPSSHSFPILPRHSFSSRHHHTISSPFALSSRSRPSLLGRPIDVAFSIVLFPKLLQWRRWPACALDTCQAGAPHRWFPPLPPSSPFLCIVRRERGNKWWRE